MVAEENQRWQTCMFFCKFSWCYNFSWEDLTLVNFNLNQKAGFCIKIARKNYPQIKLPTKMPPNVMSVSYSGSENVNDSSVNVTKSAGNPVVYYVWKPRILSHSDFLTWIFQKKSIL